MTKELKTALILVGIPAGVTTAAAVVTAGVCLREVQAAKKMIGTTSARISKMSQIEVDQSLVDRLVTEAAKTKADAAAQTAADRIRSEMMVDIRQKVSEAVKAEAEKISAKVASEVEDNSSETIRKKVVESATEQLIDKMSNSLDEKVARAAKIYSGLSAALK